MAIRNFGVMKFIDKYPKLKQKDFLVELITRNVYTTMALEDQKVEQSRVRDIVLSLVEENDLENGKFHL